MTYLSDLLEPGAIDAAIGTPTMRTDEVADLSAAISLKRIADALDSSDIGGKPQGSVLYWLEMIASAAQAGRS